ncbi:unnamed protein product [Caenorhabditis sp. 36 PRJEB53466]|nr:unnamed protein product [Caenorhabditis sp. 36 PRJEB53466]
MLVLFFLNFEFDEKYGRSRAVTTQALAEMQNENLTTRKVRYLSSKLATTARLANHIFELVSLYGMSKTLHRKPAIFVEDLKYTRLMNGIQKIFPALLEKFTIFKTQPPPEAERFLLSEKCCKFDSPDKIDNVTSEYLHLTGHFYQSWRYFDEFREEVLAFVKPAINFSPLPESNDENFITCIHIRRTDFVDGEHHASNISFTTKALEFVRNSEQLKIEKTKKMLTVIMGDDADYEETMFPKTVRARKGAEVKNTTQFFVSVNMPQNDLAYSRYNCDAVLITAPSSTFGWWLGYLSKGQSVYYQDIRFTNDVNYRKGELDPDDFFVPRWTALNMNANGDIVKVS